MAVIQQTSFGKIEFSDEFLSNLAGVATMECYGIVGMASQKAMDGIVELLKGENLNKGVEIVTMDRCGTDSFVCHRGIWCIHICRCVERYRYRQIPC